NKDLDFFPKDIETEHADLCSFLHDNVNNGVYRAGFATRQRPYEVASRKLFEALDQLEERLSKSRFLFDNRIVESDWRFFCTLLRSAGERVSRSQTFSWHNTSLSSREFFESLFRRDA